MPQSDVCPTEDAVKAFLEQLVDPMLPAKSSIRDNPTPSHQQSVAKQVFGSPLVPLQLLQIASIDRNPLKPTEKLVE